MEQAEGNIPWDERESRTCSAIGNCYFICCWFGAKLLYRWRLKPGLGADSWFSVTDNVETSSQQIASNVNSVIQP